MGTYITLDVGAIEITWSKNHPGPDHSCLFHETDRVEIRHDWSGDDDCHQGFRSTVAAVLPRIELLGHTLDRARREYETAITINTRERLEHAEAVGEPAPSTDYLAFDEVLTVARSLCAKHLSKEIDEDDREPKRVLASEHVSRLPWYGVEEYRDRSFEIDNVFSQSTSAEYVLGGFDPYTIIRLLAENADNLDCPVTWDYGPLVSGGHSPSPSP